MMKKKNGDRIASDINRVVSARRQQKSRLCHPIWSPLATYTTEHLKSALSEMKCAISIKYTPDLKDLIPRKGKISHY